MRCTNCSGVLRYRQITVRRPEQVVIKKTKKENRTYRVVDLAFSADHRIKMKEKEKKDKYHDLAGESKKIELESDG